MVDEVDSRFTPALHPANIATVDGYCDETRAVLEPTESAFRSCYEGLRAVHDFRALAASNAAWTEASQIIQTDNLANKHRDKVARTFDITRQRLLDGVGSIERELSAPVASKGAANIAAEVRAHVKGLPTGERMALVRQVIASGDDTSATAVLGGPAFLSGLTDEMQGVLTRIYHERNSPQAVLRLRAMRGAVELIERNAPLMHQAFADAVGCPPHQAAKLRAANTAAEKAAVFRDEG